MIEYPTHETYVLTNPTDDLFHLLKSSHDNSSKDSTAFLLAQIERQNALLEKDPKSIYLESNQLKADIGILERLVHDSHIGFWENLIREPERVMRDLPYLLQIKLRSGVPDRKRGEIWRSLSQSNVYEEMYDGLGQERSGFERLIERDLARTFPRIEMFREEGGEGQARLRRVLVAYSVYDPEVGYCQGLGFLVGPLLLNMPERQSFGVFVRLMETYGMRSMFTSQMEGLHVRLFEFSIVSSQELPELDRHLKKYGIHPAMYASQWFLTIFAYVFPMELVQLIYDVIFVEGGEVLLRVAITLLKRSSQVLLEKREFEEILDYLTSDRLCEVFDDHHEVIHEAMSLQLERSSQKKFKFWGKKKGRIGF